MERKMEKRVIIGPCENGKRVIEWEEKRPITQLQCLGAPPVAMSHTHSAFIIFSSSSSLFLKESKRTTFLLICVLGVTSGSFPYLMSDTRPQN